MDKFQSFERGAYVTNGNMSGIVKTYSLNSGYDVNDNAFSQFGKYIHLYIGFYRSTNSGNVIVLREVVDFNDGSFRGMDDSEINEFNQILLKNGYIWDPDSMKVIEMKATILKDNKKETEMVKKETEQKFNTGDFLTSIDGDTTFIFMRYEYVGWLLGWTMRFNNEEKRYNCKLEKFNPAHPWEYSTNYDKEIFLRRLKDTCYVWHNDVKEIRKEYELEVNKLRCGDIIHFRDGETVIFKEITADNLKMRVWHTPADGNVLVEYNRYTPWRYATGDEQDYILDIMGSNGYVWDGWNVIRGESAEEKEDEVINKEGKVVNESPAEEEAILSMPNKKKCIIDKAIENKIAHNIKVAKYILDNTLPYYIINENIEGFIKTTDKYLKRYLNNFNYFTNKEDVDEAIRRVKETLMNFQEEIQNRNK
jgi:hypothetical protein